MGRFFRDISWTKQFLYIIPLCYLFYSLFIEIFHGNGNLSSRANFLIIWLFIGFALSEKGPLKQPVVSALVFCIYTCLVLLFSPSNFEYNYISVLSCIFVWPFALYNSCNIKLSKNDLEISSIFLGITCNVIAFIWFTGIRTYHGPNSVLAYNSVYYILIATLYVFLIRKTIIQIILLPYPIFVLISSGKTTCVVLAAALVIYYIFDNLRKKGLVQKIGLIALVTIVGFWFLFSINITEIYDSVFFDFDNGGSGRTDIWANALNIISNSDISLFIGHGYGATTSILNIGAHNDLLEIFIDFGLIGVVLYIIFCYQIFIAYKRITPVNKYRLIYVMTFILFISMSMVSKLVGTQIQFLLFTTMWGMLLQHKLKSNAA